MATAHLNFAARLNQGTVGVEAQCFPGVGAQDRVDIASVPASQPTSPQAVVATGVRYVEVITDAKVKVYAGAEATGADDTAKAAVRAARAMVIDTARAFEVAAGHVIYVWTV
ncbi:hypothetical protein [Brevundimonas subvibrioides]|uniref:Uncharacterized protein n=1 Tax=Brevundimonas subvibrioides (strain ATCC 15264 / DSM 4735 / LMG 14903 / NBRC 16000 / CB 81) TaxID=633149 RepID=D9QI73_BRESC|nr:hypothetical protein [Brevundimonas subvibrioides]ADK99375.1 hypothetical protein Bresu_0061 [Brevundimonas subvibrioides ATCC 15264]